ncbi:hypothetical protein GLYMA_20G106000v4 [Glycine max]|uniref:Uncharacterized protein n=1 Tax=Glycine max TaxID=3847 RepID=K7N2S0_SOYBN|nr:hypothetical protein JHK84_055928 [Glycine max]KHN11508.1 hypothetical protein glysoja_015403 [Glycine soja]KRG90650.1 hypothetical protein GLYMA_20G106000v4 [Glycine max]
MCDSNIASIESPCDALSVDAPGMFRFDVIYNCAVLREGVEEVRMAWNMVLRGWKGLRQTTRGFYFDNSTRV